MRLFTFLVAVTLALAVNPFSAHASAVELAASLDECAGCDNGNVVLTMDGGVASVFGLVESSDRPGHWTAIGHVSYNAQGVVIDNAEAVFDVELAASPTASVVGCERATKFASAIRAVGIKGEFTLDASNLVIDTSLKCATATLDVSINDHPKSVGKLKKLYRA